MQDDDSDDVSRSMQARRWASSCTSPLLLPQVHLFQVLTGRQFLAGAPFSASSSPSAYTTSLSPSRHRLRAIGPVGCQVMDSKSLNCSPNRPQPQAGLVPGLPPHSAPFCRQYATSLPPSQPSSARVKAPLCRTAICCRMLSKLPATTGRHCSRFAASLCSILPTVHCKKELAIFPSPAGMSLTKLSLGGKKLNYSRPGRV